MVEPRKEATCLQMRRGEQIAQRRHRRERDAALLRGVVEFRHRLLAAPLLEEDLQGVEVLATCQPVLEELEARPLRAAHQLDELLPLVLFDAADEDPAVAAL